MVALGIVSVLVWILLLIYLYNLSRKNERLRKEVEALEEMIEKSKERKG